MSAQPLVPMAIDLPLDLVEEVSRRAEAEGMTVEAWLVREIKRHPEIAKRLAASRQRKDQGG